MSRRIKTRPEPPTTRFLCGCVTFGPYGHSYCAEATRLWDKVNAANHNLMQTRKVAETWVKPWDLYAPARVAVRQAIYEYRKADYGAHFGIDPRPAYRRAKRTLPRLTAVRR